jgi:hypothetical protein
MLGHMFSRRLAGLVLPSRCLTRVALLVATFSLSAFGFQQQSTDLRTLQRVNDREWARETGLRETQIRNLRVSAGIPDGSPSDPIRTIESGKLAHGHILLVMTGLSDDCVAVSVWRHHRQRYESIWSTGKAPNGLDLCHHSRCRHATAWVTQDKQIWVSVPHQNSSNEFGQCDVTTFFKYRWTGHTYALTGEENASVNCAIDTYYDALDIILGGLTESRIVSIQVLRPFVPEYAVVFSRDKGTLLVNHLLAHRKVWPELGIFLRRQTPSECIHKAQVIPVDRTPIPLTEDKAAALMRSLGEIDLHSSPCPVDDNGKRVDLLDPTVYVVQTENSVPIHLTDTLGMKHVRSENDALLRWVSEVLELVSRTAPHP